MANGFKYGNLIEMAKKARAKAYAPYSKFFVGCAVLLKNKSVVMGGNIENASYPTTICAEVSALIQVIAKGEIDNIEAIAVSTKSSPPAAPCGMCRQFFSEFLHDEIPIFLVNDEGEVVKTSMPELLPNPFTQAELSFIPES